MEEKEAAETLCQKLIGTTDQSCYSPLTQLETFMKVAIQVIEYDKSSAYDRLFITNVPQMKKWLFHNLQLPVNHYPQQRKTRNGLTIHCMKRGDSFDLVDNSKAIKKRRKECPEVQQSSYRAKLTLRL